MTGFQQSDRERAIQAAGAAIAAFRNYYRDPANGPFDGDASDWARGEAERAADAVLASLPAVPQEGEGLRGEQLRKDFTEAQRLLREGDTEGLAALASRGVEQRAIDAARRARETEGEGLRKAAEALIEACKHVQLRARTPDKLTRAELAFQGLEAALASAGEPAPVTDGARERAAEQVWRKCSGITTFAWARKLVDVALGAALGAQEDERE